MSPAGGPRVRAEAEAYGAQCAVLADWLDTLPATMSVAATVLPGWDVRTLVGHLVASSDGFAHGLTTRAAGPEVPIARYVQAYADAADDITAATVAITGDRALTDLIAALRSPVPVPDDVRDQTVLAGPRGATTALSFARTRLLDLVVHVDDLSRSAPDAADAPWHRPALASAVRTLAEILTGQAPGRSVEVRIPPFAAVQAIDGPRHTRGTPPNVVETDAVTWLRVATGRTTFADAMRTGKINATGPRSDLTAFLPLLT